MASSTFIPLSIHPEDAKILRLSELLDIGPDEALGKAVRWFRWVDQHCTSAKTGITANHLDEFVVKLKNEKKSFANAMADDKIGWIKIAIDGEVVILGYSKWLSKSAKRRRLDASRKAKSRADKRPQNVRNDADKKRTCPQAEERRGEESIGEENNSDSVAEPRVRESTQLLNPNPSPNKGGARPQSARPPGPDSDSGNSNSGQGSVSGFGIRETDSALLAVRRSLRIETPAAFHAKKLSDDARRQAQADWTDWVQNIEPAIRAGIGTQPLDWFTRQAAEASRARKPSAAFRKRLEQAGINVTSLRADCALRTPA